MKGEIEWIFPACHRGAEVRSLDAIAGQARDWLFDAAAHLWRAESDGGTPLFPERLSIQGEEARLPASPLCPGAPRLLLLRARQAWLDRTMAGDGSRQHRIPHRAWTSRGRVLHQPVRPQGRRVRRACRSLRSGVHVAGAAHAGRALERRDLFAVAEELGDALDRSWRLPHGGYFEGEIAVCPPFRQNPHMHLLECFVALHRASGASALAPRRRAYRRTLRSFVPPYGERRAARIFRC